ncbi:MAG TPA: winged helix-turn-helix domain-containing protein [Steroidobacteraceae bacterium]|nr:winged helix-turn-helix domain-containing protein [Steroidobacteraceae bacterium]
MTRTSARYGFGDFALDVSQQRLTRRTTGEVIPLTAKAFDTLLYLVEHAAQTLDRDELLRAIWPGVVVEENSLSQNISTLRQVLGEARGENRYILTIPRKGYRFVAQVTTLDELAASTESPVPAAAPATKPPSRRRILQICAGAGVLTIMIAAISLSLVSTRARPTAPLTSQTLAVLPFKPLVPAERNESLELGMTESLIASLGQQGAQAIAPLTSVRRYAALDQDAISAGRELGVKTVLDGSLQRRGDRLRVSARLLRVADGRQLWAGNFDQDFTTIFDVQDAIATKVARALELRGVVDGVTRGAPYTHDPEAYALYASGRFAWTRQTEASLLQAIDFYQQAIARDPNYALAYAGLADSHAVLGVFGMRAPRDVFPDARRAVEKALAIDPDLAAAHSALGHIMVQYDHDWEGAAREYARAKQLDPSLALTYHRRSILYAVQGDTDRALAESARARELEPLWLAPRTFTGHILYYARRYDEGIKILEQVLALDDRVNSARGFLIRGLIARGDYARALDELDQHPLQTQGSYAFRAQALALSGRRDAALAELDRILKLSKERYVAAYDIAMIYVVLGDKESAFQWLERAMEDRSTPINFLAQDPALDPLHGDPRFAALVQRLGIYHRTLPDS